jgi:predicted outer membrane protein
MVIDATAILELIITILAGVVCTYLIPYLKQKRLTWLVSTAVAAAEQAMKDSTGAEKKEYVIKWLANRGITYDSDKIDAVIESAVYEVKNANTATTVSTEK